MNFSHSTARVSRFIVIALISALVSMTWLGSVGPTVALSAGDPQSFTLGLNPGLAAGKPFACPAMQGATASIAVTNRFVEDAQNDTMTLTASGLPPNTGFDVFIVQNSPLDAGFTGFGSAWYQSDMESDGSGHATVVMQGIFDQETFIENPADPFTPIHTFNVGFWFDSPTIEQQTCGNATAPAATPFNGEQHAGLLAMVTTGGPLQQIADTAPAAGLNSPRAGTVSAGKAQTFVTTCSDPNGWKNIHRINLRLTNGSYHGTAKALVLWVQYDQNANLVRFYDPATKRWTQGAPGSNKTLSGRYASLSLAHTSAKGLGPTNPTVMVTWQVVFKTPAIGNNYRQGLQIEDDFGVTKGWHTVGSWNIGPPGYAGAQALLRHQTLPPRSPASVATAPSRASCDTASCTFSLGINPGLLPGMPFACPTIQHAQATITVTNRFVTHEQNDTMTLTASGLPPHASFDVFLVQNSPLDAGFSNFGFGWYQSDLQADASGNASITVRGIFDHEVFIDNPTNAFSPIHTFNVGFWFGSPNDARWECGNQKLPAATPFNGEQHAGLLAMITSGQPLGTL